MKRLMVDLDNCITNALYLERVNEFLKTDYKLEDQTEFELQKLTGKRINEFWKYMEDKSYYDDAPLIEGAYDALKVLNDKYELYVITAYICKDSSPDISGNNLKYKYEYLKRKLPFIDPEQYVFTEKKNLIHSDIAIDDKINNLENADKKILINAWHNKNISDIFFNETATAEVYTWKEILSMLDY